MSRRSNEAGFSLLELMAVVVTIGILVTIAIPVFQGAAESARESSCFSTQRIIESAVQRWSADNGGADVNELNGRLGLDPETDVLVDYVHANLRCHEDPTGHYSLLNGIVTCPAGHPHY